MLAARHLCCVLLASACADSTTRLDQVTAGEQPPAAQAGEGSDDGSGDGFDLRGMLAKVGDAIAKPGHYEAPDSSADFDADEPHWGVLTLSGQVVERTSFSWSGGSGTELAQLAARLRQLARDDSLTGVVLRFDDLEVSMTDVVELRAALRDLQHAGKRVGCHTEGSSNATYLVLSACDRIAMAPLGDLVINGPSAMPVHIRPLLERLGVQADFLHVGAYKGAAEPLTRDAPSREMQETIAAILDRRYQTMVETIAADRKLAADAVRALIDTGLFPSEQARSARLIDDVAGFEAFRAELTGGAPWTKLELDPAASDRMMMVMKLSRFLGALPVDKPVTDHVAVVYALGNIIDGEGEGRLGARQEIASHTLVAALRALTSDDTVKAVVLRIDSGGGSAQASELIWRAVADLKARKPVIVSMSDVAASGGYYIAAGATKIFALDDTLTGSIGVVGGKLAVQGGLARLGVNTFPVGRGKRATMTGSLAPWSDDERQAIRNTMQEVYRVFVGRVAEGRKLTPAQVQAIAEGRVWTGEKAKQLGLVDEIGGLDAAIAEARRLAKVDDATGLEVYPPAPTLRDVVTGFGEVGAPRGLSLGPALGPSFGPSVGPSLGPTLDGALAALAAVDPAVAQATEHLIRLVLSFRASRVQTVALLPVLP